MTEKVETLHAAGFILSEANGNLSRDNAVLASGENRGAGTVLGKTVTAGTIAGAAAAGNTGNGTIGTLSVGGGAQEGVYRAVCIEPATDAGKFEVSDPAGVVIGVATVAVAFTGQVNFTIADGGTDFIAGDAFNITVSQTTEKHKILAPAATDGTERAAGILLADTDASAADQKCAVVARQAAVNGLELTWPGGITAAQKDIAITQLASLGIVVRSVLVLALAAGLLAGVLPGDPAIAMAAVGLGILDVFKADGFSVTSMTDRVNKMPYVPGRAGEVIAWEEEGVPTTTIMIEEQSGNLVLINPSARGGPGVSVAKDKRKVRNLNVPHIQIDDAVMAEEVQGVREFGQVDQVQTVQGIVDTRMQQHVRLRIDPTLEYQRVGAVRGIILNPDGSQLYNLFTEFNVLQPAEVAFNLGAAANGAVRKTCTDVVRTIAAAMGGIPFQGVYALCSDAFWDDLIMNAEVRATYLGTVAASELRAGVAFERFNFGGITFENYRGAVTGSTQFVLTDKAHFFPVGSPGLWRTVYSPADYVETVNTIGLPRYARQYPMPNGKGVSLEVQSNPLSYCTRPNTLVQGKRGA